MDVTAGDVFAFMGGMPANEVSLPYDDRGCYDGARVCVGGGRLLLGGSRAIEAGHRGNLGGTGVLAEGFRQKVSGSNGLSMTQPLPNSGVAERRCQPDAPRPNAAWVAHK